jgi:citrate synthase
VNIMKNIILVLTLLTLSSNLAYSEEVEPELMEASQEYVINLLSMCKGYAQEDEVSKSEMENYLVTCINDELAESSYKAITVLPE